MKTSTGAAAAAVIAAGLVTGCASTRPYGNAEYLVPAGSRLVLQTELGRAGDSRRIYFQAGQRVTQSSKDQYEPYCFFRLSPDGDGELPSAIGPATFTTGPATNRANYSALDRGAPVHVAAHGLHHLHLSQASGGGAGSYSYFEYSTEIRLQSDQEPTVKSLTCARFANPNNLAGPHYLNRQQIHDVLAGIGELRLNTGSAADADAREY